MSKPARPYSWPFWLSGYLWLRAPLLLLHLLAGALIAQWRRLRHGEHWYARHDGARTIQRWMTLLNRLLGLKVTLEGTPASAPTLLVANHISWLDITAIAANCPARFLAKQPVRQWPLIGSLAAASGTVFLRRGDLAVLHEAIDSLAEVLRGGERVMIFPEGTTTSGRQVGVFHRALFQAAIDAGTPVQAVALRYGNHGEPDMLAPFIGDDDFFPHLLRILARPDTELRVCFLPEQDSDNSQRKILATRAHEQISTALQHPAGDIPATPALDMGNASPR